MVTKLLSFPSANDLDVITSSIRYFLTHQSGYNRESMLQTIRGILDKYNISKCNLDKYSVHRATDSNLSFIYGKILALTNLCPGCNCDIYASDGPVRILSIKEGIKDRVTYGCRCGAIFYRLEKS